MKKYYNPLTSFFDRKKFCVILSILLFSQLLVAQPYWLRPAGGLGQDEGMDISSDAAGNTYTTGYFNTLADFDTMVRSTNGISDAFIVKTRPSGIIDWVINFGGTGPDRGLSIETDANGYSYVTGYFFQGADLGNGVFLTANSGSQDMFVAKFDPNGMALWAKSGGGPKGDKGNSITIDQNGNVIVTGQYNGAATFGNVNTTSMNDPDTGEPTDDIFVAKYDTNGNLQWLKTGAAPFIDRGLGVGADSQGNIYAIGQFSDTITFDQTHTNNQYNSIFIIKYDPSGNEQWFRKIGGSIQNIAYDIALDAADNIYLTGDFQNSMTFFTPSQHTINGDYRYNIFVAKMSSDGEHIWSDSDGSDNQVSSRAISLDQNSNMYITGNFLCTFTEYSEEHGTGAFNSLGYKDIFVSKYNNSGTRDWFKHMGSSGHDNGEGVVIPSGTDAIYTGSFNRHLNLPVTASFLGYDASHISAGSTCDGVDIDAFLSKGGSDIFIGKCIDPTLPPINYYKTSCNYNYEGVYFEAFPSNTHVYEICSDLSLHASTHTYGENTGISSPVFDNSAHFYFRF